MGKSEGDKEGRSIATESITLQNYNIQVDDVSMMEYIRWCQDRTKDTEEWFGIRIRGFLADKKGVTSVQLRRINLR